MRVMFRNIVCIVVAILALVGCRHTEGKQILSDEQMVRILADMHIAEAASRSYPDSLRDTLLQQVFEEVYLQHRTTKSDFESTLRFLSFVPEHMITVYDSVQVSLKRRQKMPTR